MNDMTSNKSSLLGRQTININTQTKMPLDELMQDSPVQTELPLDDLIVPISEDVDSGIAADSPIYDKIYLTVTDSVDLLPLSPGCVYKLKKLNIVTIEQLLMANGDNIFQFLHKSYRLSDSEYIEIISCIMAIREGKAALVMVDNDKKRKVFAQAPIKYLYKYISIRSLSLSDRTKNALYRADIINLYLLSGIGEYQLRTIKGIGANTIKEISSFIEKLTETDFVKKLLYSNPAVSPYLQERCNPQLDTSRSNSQGALTAWINESKNVYLVLDDGRRIYPDEIARCLGGNKSIYAEIMCRIISDNNSLPNEEYIDLFYADEVVKNVVTDVIKKRIKEHFDGISKEHLHELLPSGIHENYIDSILSPLLSDNVIQYSNGIILYNYPSFIEHMKNEAYIQRLDQLDIVSRFISGTTLQALSDEIGLTREGIRQKIKNEIRFLLNRRKCPDHPYYFKEDKYAALYAKYTISCENFISIFNESIQTYRYLILVHRPKNTRFEKKPLQEAVNDPELPTEIRAAIQTYFSPIEITVEGIRMQKSRPLLVNYYIQHYCVNETKYDMFLKGYNEWLQSQNIFDEETAIMSNRYFELRLNSLDNILWSQWKRFRYYDIKNRDFTELLGILDSYLPKNIVISSLKLYRENTSIMSKYDIRNEYELHNLLRRIWPSYIKRVKFHRMPTIEIGTAFRTDQMYQLLTQFSPIHSVEFARKYEELYGDNYRSVMGNIPPEISRYCHNGVYSLQK